jgi:hypothetical protein
MPSRALGSRIVAGRGDHRRGAEDAEAHRVSLKSFLCGPL